jgi:hypothetical protein
MTRLRGRLKDDDVVALIEDLAASTGQAIDAASQSHVEALHTVGEMRSIIRLDEAGGCDCFAG